MSRDPLVTPEAAADRLGVSPRTLAIWRCTGRYDLPFVKCGARVRYRTSAIENFLERRTRNLFTGQEPT